MVGVHGAGVVGSHGLVDVDGRTGGKLLDVSPAFDIYRCHVRRVGGDFGSSAMNPQMQPMTAIPDRKSQHSSAFRPHRAEHQTITPGFQAGETALQEVDAAGHRGQVNALGGGTALAVRHI